MSQSIEDGKVVQFHYTLTNGEGQVIDSSRERDPLAYLHGAGNIVPGLESALTDHEAGDSFEATVPPAQGYGEKQGPGPQSVPRDQFPDDMPLQPGMPFMAQTPDGEQVQLWIHAIQGEQVLVDQNHPLAGETLHFDVEVVEIRDATDEEKEHGHPHGPGGQEH